MSEVRTGYRPHVVAAVVVLTGAIYLSSGTMAPYGATLAYPLVLEPCHYLVNVDHYQFEAVYRMIRGDAPSQWAGSVVLRRLLFPVISYPFVSMAGFLAGGLLASVLVHVLSLIVFAGFIRRRFGDAAAIATLWLLSTYPGITYWAGLPYSYVAIVPGSLMGLILLYRIEESPALADVLRGAFLLGLISTAYDLLPFFGPAAMIVLAARRRWLPILPAGIAMVVPGLLVAVMLSMVGVSAVNSNTANYLIVVLSYLNPDRYDSVWLAYMLELPLILVSNALYSNVVFLPLLAVAGSWVLWRRKLEIVALPEKGLLVSGLLLFLFTNAAPPYYGWQMRGYWVARLYQPLLVVLLMIVARLTHHLVGTALAKWRMAVVATVVLNASVAFGPVLMNPLAGFVYHKFYVHSPPESLLINLQRYGRRPLGFCDPSHQRDGIKDPNTPFNRPPFMYRYPPR